MVRKSEEKQVVTKPAPFNGVGEITVRSLLNGPEEMSQKGRVFGHTTVYPGAAIGYHVHHGDSERRITSSAARDATTTTAR